MRKIRVGKADGGWRGIRAWAANIALGLTLTLLGTGCNEVLSREVRQGVLDIVMQSVDSVSSGVTTGLSTAITNALP
jgi:deoxyhypusine synthase